MIPAGVLCLATSAVVVIVGLTGTSGRHKATPTAAALMSAVNTGSNGYSGTLVAQLSLNLPVTPEANNEGASVLLMAGAHTMRYWYGGPNRQRVALIGANSEADVFCNGDSVWQWNSATNIATRSALPKADSASLGAPVFPAPMTYAALTPRQLSQRMLAAVGSDTSVTVAPGPTVADRSTYRLTLRPAAQVPTRIASVRIEVDAHTKVPLGVQVYARGQQNAAVDVSFSSITYRTPEAEVFRFTPPPDATVRRGVVPQLLANNQSGVAEADGFTKTDTGWSAVTAFRLAGDKTPTTMSIRPAMHPVSGSWGRCYLLETPLLCLLVTENGRVLTGSVDPQVLYAIAAG